MALFFFILYLHANLSSMKRTTYIIVLILIPLTALLFTGYSSGQTQPYSGSPGDGGNTCAVCHSGGNFNASVEITTDIPEEGYVAGESYTVTVTASSSASKHGFQITAENISNAKAGTFAAGTGSQTGNANHLVTHTSSGTSMTEWNMTWTAPADTSGDNAAITFYAVLNAANGNGSTSGDQIVTTNLSYEANTTGVGEWNTAHRLPVFPNPVSGELHLNDEFNGYNYLIYDHRGYAVDKGTIDMNTVDIDLPAGIYLFVVDKDGTLYHNNILVE